MGLHPIALSLGHGLRVSGVAQGPVHLDESELGLLLRDGHAIEAHSTIPPGTVGPLCAAWIGQDFERTAEDTDAPDLPFERHRMTRIKGEGWYLLDTPATVFGALDRWIRQAFATAIDRGSHDLAALLSWVAPNRDETRAAQFITGDKEQRSQSLAWWARLERDAGRAASEEDLVRRVDAVCDRVFVDWRPDPSQHRFTGQRSPWPAIALGVRCAERLGPAVDPAPDDPPQSPVARAIRIARDAALRGRPASHAEVEPTRIALIEQVAHRWQEAKISGHLHPYALHAVESALFGAESAKEDTHLDQSLLSMQHGVSEIVYPDLTWRPIPALWGHFASLPVRAVQADRTWLMAHSEDGAVPLAFFDRELWPDGAPVAWEEHVTRFRERLFGSTADTTAG
jgi:hypothetical protein